jgi:hypothetical protein
MRPLTEAWKEIVTGRGRFSCRPSYQDHAGSAKFLREFHGSTRFGTEGSEVQILSPRPIFPEKTAKSVWQTTRFHPSD